MLRFLNYCCVCVRMCVCVCLKIDDQERLFVYLLTAGSVGVILCIVAIAIRVAVVKRNESSTDTQSTSSEKGAGVIMTSHVGGSAKEKLSETTHIPNGFNDTISEVDADIDLQTAIPVPSVSKNEVSQVTKTKNEQVQNWKTT